MLTLDLALITYGADGIDRVARMYLPKQEGVRYIISWQKSDNIDAPRELAERDDVIICRTDTRGAAINRNNAIDRCTADIILFADDDIIYTDQSMPTVIRTFEQNPDLDLACFKAIHPANPKFPDNECKLHVKLPKGYWVASFQMAMRRESLGNLRCHPAFGAGAPYFEGADDSLFLLAAIRRGLECRYFPTTICEHPQLSTGTLANQSSKSLRAQGCYIALNYGLLESLLRVPLKAWRVWRARQSSLPRALWYLSEGAFKAPGVLRSGHDYLW